MVFGNYSILIMLVWLVPALLIFFFLSYKLRRQSMNNFADSELVPRIAPGYSQKKVILRMALNVLAVVMLVAALGKPQWGFRWKEVKKVGLDITFALDTSRSMLAEDYPPNRLEFAKDGIRRFVRTLKGDRVALIAFAGDAFLQCPLTVDYRSFFLNLDMLSDESIPQGGTALASAINTAIRSYDGAVGNNRVLVIISDGEDNVGDVEGAIRKAAEQGVIICTIGIGSPGGESIPVLNEKTGMKENLKDTSGKEVVTKLEEGMLKTIASASDGVYVRADRFEFGMETIAKEKLSSLEPGETENKKIKVFSERFRYPLVLAALFLLIELLLRGTGVSRRSK